MGTIIINSNNPNDLLWPLLDRACGLIRNQAALLDARHDELIILSPPERAAYLLGNLIGQVRNGGWQQWVGNGYCVQLRPTRAVAAAIGTELSERAVGMLDELEPFLDLDYEGRRCGRWYFLMTPEQEERYQEGGNVFTEGQALCEVFDERFYNFDAKWEIEINAWLSKGAPGLTE